MRRFNKYFNNVWYHLEEGGIFIFDINSYYKLKYIIGHNTFVEDRENIFILGKIILMKTLTYVIFI